MNFPGITLGVLFSIVEITSGAVTFLANPIVENYYLKLFGHVLQNHKQLYHWYFGHDNPAYCHRKELKFKILIFDNIFDIFIIDTNKQHRKVQNFWLTGTRRELRRCKRVMIKKVKRAPAKKNRCL